MSYVKNDLRLTSSTQKNNIDVDTFDKHKEHANGTNLYDNF